MTWDELKERGSEHYKTGGGGVEPIDLIRAGGMLPDFCLGNIIKYAYRSRDTDVPATMKNLEKIRHYADMLEVELQERWAR